MASVKLKHTSGNGTILHSPAANPTNDVTLKLPSTTGSAGQVLKVASANHSSTNAELEFAAAGGGKILNVVSTIDKAQSFSVTNQNLVEYPGINTTITPSSSSSKILIMVSIAFGASGTTDGQYGFRLYDGSSVITDAYNTNASSNGQSAFLSLDDQYDFIQTNFTYLYSPNTNSETTIKVYVYGDTNRTVYVNRWGTSSSKGGVSTMTLMEVGA